MKKRMVTVVALALSCIGMVTAGAATPDKNKLDNEFVNPPMTAKPWVYWWFEGGYGSKEGMARDIAEMRDKGIGGVMHMQTVNSSRVPLPQQPKMLSDDWADWFGEAARLAGKAGMVMGASIVDGWGHGGPWVSAEDGAKMLVYSEVQTDGPGRVAQALLQPVSRSGIYHDVAVIAFPEKTRRPLTPSAVTASSANLGYCNEQNWPASNVTDGDPDTVWRAAGPPSGQSPAWLTCSFLEPMVATGALIASAKDGSPEDCELQASDDGIIFRSVVHFAMQRGETKRVGFLQTRARYFRLSITSAYVPDVQVAEFAILGDGDEPVLRHGVKWWAFKSGNRGYWRWPDKPYEMLEEDYPPDSSCDLRRDQVIDVSKYLEADGRLDWEAPAGRWTIMRFGWAPICQPARMSSNGGYEVDVLNTKGADLMADAAQTRMLEVTERVAPGVLKVFHTDSWEIGADVGGQQPTWTNDFREQFLKRRGYDLATYLPAMAQRLIDDRETTSRFLRDYRDTIADLLAAYYGRQQERAHQVGCLVNPESGYGTYPYPQMDGLRVFGRADLPMAESWHANDVMTCSDHFCDAMRTAASGARIYGRQVVQAETLTYAPLGGPMTSPEQYRRTLNRTFAEGVNQAVIHKYVHQPFEYKPGLEDYGIFSRHYTWWPMADGLFGYIGRCQYLLQQGLFAADAAYFVGEGASRFVPGKPFLKPALPMGYDYDGVDAEVLLARMSVNKGRLVLPDGLGYRYLVLSEPQCVTMSTAVLTKIKLLVQAGATVVGSAPRQTPGLTDRVAADARLRALAAELWGPSPATRGTRKVGKGRVIWGRSMEEVFSADRLKPDVMSDAAREERAGLQGASWIWHASDAENPPPCKRLFRTRIDIPIGRRVARAMLSMTADNSFDVSMDGKTVCRGDDFRKVVDADITGRLHPGSNEILVSAVNGGDGPNPAGLIGSIVVVLDNGARIVRDTDAESWMSSAGLGQWTRPRSLGQLGCGPWGQVDDGQNAGSACLDWLHRRTKDADIYFIANPSNRQTDQEVTLRSAGRRPELFDPLTGEIRFLPEFHEKDGCTTIPLQFAPAQAFFVVFREKAPGSKASKARAAKNFPVLKQVAEITGPWSVAFDAAWLSPALGASANGKVVFDTLTDWTQRPEEGIKHYSGIAKYFTSFAVLQKTVGSRMYLDLGLVKEIARVRLNGKDLGVVWSSPWRVDITPAVRSDKNMLEIDVANLWGNRTIADAALPEAQRLTKGTFRLPPQNALSSSGLLGPVTVQAVDETR